MMAREDQREGSGGNKVYRRLLYLRLSTSWQWTSIYRAGPGETWSKR